MALYRKKPIVIEAMQLTASTIKEVYKFVNGDSSVQLTCKMAEDYWENYENIVLSEGMKIKTPESGEGTQIASIGDSVVKGYTEKLGWHFWPVKPDYFELNYEAV